MLKNSPGLSSYRGFGVPSSRIISRGTFYRGENPADYSKTMLKERGDPLAEFSGIHPEKIIGKQKPTKEQALRFVSGGSPIGDSIVSGAKNKIVGFDRNIKPKPNNLQSLIGNLASNIFSTSSVSNMFNTTEKEKTPEKKEKGFKPFGGFFDRIKEALAFITFFGSKKNLDRIRENVDNLKTTFAETFEVAKSLRKVILKIIEQISGLSGGGGGGGLIGAIMSALGGLVGGLVPGLGGKRPPNIAGPAMKQEGNLISKIPKILTSGGGGISKLLLGGAAALGTGAAISGLSQPDNSENIQPGYTAPEVPGNVLDKFNSILDRFDKVIESLLKGKGSGSQKPGGSKPSGSGGGGGSPTITPPPPGAPTGVTIKDDAQALKELGLTQEQYNALKQGVADVEGARYNQMGGAGTRFAGRYQMGSNEIADSAKVMGIPVPSQQEYLNNPELQEKIYMGRTVYMHRRLQSLSPKYNTMSPRERTVALGMGQLGEGNVSSYINTGILPKDSAGVPITKWGTVVGKRFDEALSIPPKPQPGQAPTLNPAPGQAPQTPTPKPAPGQAPQAPTPKPAPGQQSIQVVPVQQQSQVQPAPSGGGGNISAPPSPKQNGPTAPFLPSSNPNNFLTLYSRMVYNIVDG